MIAASFSGDARRYTSVAQAAHWVGVPLLLAALILAWVFMAMPAEAPGRFVYITLHKSIGQTLFFLTLFRLIWRRLHPPPPLNDTVAAWEAHIARVNHWLLHAIMIYMPVTGYILAVAAARPSPYFWLFYWPQPMLSPSVTHLALRAHLIGQFLVYAFVGLHVIGVVWDVAVRRNRTLERMLPAHQSRPASDEERAPCNASGLGVTTAAAVRSCYEEAVLGFRQRVMTMREQGATSEAIARTVHAERRMLAIAFKDLTAEPLRSGIYARTVALYGDPAGPTIDRLRAQGKSWDDIIESATRPGPRPPLGHITL